MSKPILWEQSSPLMNTLRNVNDGIAGMKGYTLIDLDAYVKLGSKKMFCEHKKMLGSKLSWLSYEALHDLHLHYKDDKDFWGIHLIRYDKSFDYKSEERVVNTGKRIWKVDPRLATFNIDGVINVSLQNLIKFKRFHLRNEEIYDSKRGVYISLFDRPNKEYMKLVG